MVFHDLDGDASGVDLEQIVCTLRGSFEEDAFVAGVRGSRRAASDPADAFRVRPGRSARPGGRRDRRDSACACRFPRRRCSERPNHLADVLAGRPGRGRRPRTGPGHAPDVRRSRRGRGAASSGPSTMRSSTAARSPSCCARCSRSTTRSSPRTAADSCRCRARIASTSSSCATSTSRARRRTGDDASRASPRRRRSVIDRCHRDDRTTGTPVQGVAEQRLSRETTTALREFAASQGVTVNTLLQAAWAVLLHRYSGETGRRLRRRRAPAGARRSPDADEMVGLFINTLPLRVDVDPERALDDLLRTCAARRSSCASTSTRHS